MISGYHYDYDYDYVCMYLCMYICLVPWCNSNPMTASGAHPLKVPNVAAFFRIFPAFFANPGDRIPPPLDVVLSVTSATFGKFCVAFVNSCSTNYLHSKSTASCNANGCDNCGFEHFWQPITSTKSQVKVSGPDVLQERSNN